MENKETLAQALNKFQAAFHGVEKDASNPFFKSAYSSLHAVWSAVREPLTKSGLSIFQTVASVPVFQVIETPTQNPMAQAGTMARTTNEVRKDYVVKTTLLHVSGENITFDFPILCAKVNDPQAFGSAVSYARRYALSAVLGVSQYDDDGEKATDHPSKIPAKQAITDWKNKQPVKAAPEVKKAYTAGEDAF